MGFRREGWSRKNVLSRQYKQHNLKQNRKAPSFGRRIQQQIITTTSNNNNDMNKVKNRGKTSSTGGVLFRKFSPRCLVDCWFRQLVARPLLEQNLNLE